MFGKLLRGLQFKATILLPGVAPASISTVTTSTEATITLTTDSSDNLVKCYDHSHIFKNIPLTLHDQNSKVRDEASAMNKGNRVPATRRYHKKK